MGLAAVGDVALNRIIGTKAKRDHQLRKAAATHASCFARGRLGVSIAAAGGRQLESAVL